jgi:site-specific DNA-adenine methylase
MLDENFSIHYCAYDFMDAVSELASQSIPDWDKYAEIKMAAFQQYLFSNRRNGELVYFDPSFDLNCSLYDDFDFEGVVLDKETTEKFYKLVLKELIEQSEILVKSLKSNGGKQTILLHYTW